MATRNNIATIYLWQSRLPSKFDRPVINIDTLIRSLLVKVCLFRVQCQYWVKLKHHNKTFIFNLIECLYCQKFLNAEFAIQNFPDMLDTSYLFNMDKWLICDIYENNDCCRHQNIFLFCPKSCGRVWSSVSSVILWCQFYQTSSFLAVFTLAGDIYY